MSVQGRSVAMTNSELGRRCKFGNLYRKEEERENRRKVELNLYPNHQRRTLGTKVSVSHSETALISLDRSANEQTRIVYIEL